MLGQDRGQEQITSNGRQRTGELDRPIYGQQAD